MNIIKQKSAKITPHVKKEEDNSTKAIKIPSTLIVLDSSTKSSHQFTKLLYKLSIIIKKIHPHYTIINMILQIVKSQKLSRQNRFHQTIIV